MYKINSTANNAVNEELALIRQVDKEQALSLRKVYSTLTCQLFPIEPTTPEELLESLDIEQGSLKARSTLIACRALFEWLTFEEVEEVPAIEIKLEDENDRFDFIETTNYADMTPEQLSLVLFRDLGTEVEMTTQSMTTGLKLKLDMLDELKHNLVMEYPEIRTEILTTKLANALALTKLEKGSSLDLTEGNLSVYNYLADTRNIDGRNFEFLAEIGGDKTKALDILILESVFKTYKEHVAKGELPATCSDLNIAIMKAIQGVKPLSTASKNKLKNLF